MFRALSANQDTYITDRIIKKQRKTNANVGQAATLDLFRIFGQNTSSSAASTFINENELSRILLKFDLSSIKEMHRSGTIDISHPSFNCSLRLFDLPSGLPAPNNFKLILFPISSSWDEGLGRDIVFFSDTDTSNFITRSYSDNIISAWNLSGANKMGLLGSSDIDIISSGSLGAGIVNLFTTQSFTTGLENVNFNITQLVSATIADLIPDNGYRISFSGTQETDEKTRFVKRFGSRHISNVRFAPRLDIKFDDSVIDNHNNIIFDQSGSLFLYNQGYFGLENLVSGTALTQITGTNSLVLWLKMEISGGFFSQSFTASQYKIGTNFVSGIYSSSFILLSNNQHYKKKLLETGSVKLQEIWASLDDTVAFLTSSITISAPQRTLFNPIQKTLSANITNIKSEYSQNQNIRLRVFIDDDSNEILFFKKIPQKKKSIIFNKMYYRVRDIISNEIIIDFDKRYNSTKLSSDTEGMYFDLWTGNLYPGIYTIDLLLDENQERILTNVSQLFRILAIP